MAKGQKAPSGAPSEARFDHRSAVIRFGDLTYTLRGVSPAVVSFLRVPVQIEREGRVYLDRVDLSSARARKRFAAGAAKKLGAIQESLIEGHLLSIVSALEERARLDESNGTLFAKQDPELSAEDRSRAVEFLRQNDLVDAIENDLTALGYVGEAENKKLAFLVSVSRKLPGPLAGIIRSSSGTGKSALLDLVARVTPPEDVVFLSELTPHALYYLDPGALRGKLIVVDERAGSERADYPIRTLLSRQALSLAVTIADPATGRRRTRLVEVHGPVAYLESTTEAILNPENTSRALEIFLDESPEQTRRIQEAQREKRLQRPAGPSDSGPGDLLIIQRLQNAQRCLEPLAVFVPFAKHLSFPSELPRYRRDHEKFLRLIEAVTLLHQHQRVKTKEALVATLEDYRIAFSLARRVLARGSETITTPMREVMAVLAKHQVGEFTRRDLAQWLGGGWSAMKVWRVLGDLAKADLVLPLAAKNGVRRQYRALEIFTDGASAVSRLVPPDELARRLTSKGGGTVS